MKLRNKHSSGCWQLWDHLCIRSQRKYRTHTAADVFNALITSLFPPLQELSVLLPGQALLNDGLNTFDDSSVAFFSRSTVSRCILMQKYKLQCTIIQRQGSLLELGHFWKSALHQCCITSNQQCQLSSQTHLHIVKTVSSTCSRADTSDRERANGDVLLGADCSTCCEIQWTQRLNYSTLKQPLSFFFFMQSILTETLLPILASKTCKYYLTL